jgi:hypothetical protein
MQHIEKIVLFFNKLSLCLVAFLTHQHLSVPGIKKNLQPLCCTMNAKSLFDNFVICYTNRALVDVALTMALKFGFSN